MKTSSWLLLVINLPGRNPALRMRVWRALKAAGAGMLRDGVYLLPESAPALRTFEEQAALVRAAGGSAQVLPLGEPDGHQHGFQRLFDRSADYSTLLRRIETFHVRMRGLGERRARRELTALRRDGALLVGIDFFPGSARGRLDDALADAESAVAARFSTGEPHATGNKVALRARRDYQSRRWATRRRLWVDRVCSAWLIRRFIDPKATFIWLASPARLPRGAVGFDFDGAEFSHVGNLVTFQVLLASFGLERDSALAHMGLLVNGLDIGGVLLPEAAGFAAILSGARAGTSEDDALIKLVFPVLDLLYAGSAEAQEHRNAAISPAVTRKRT